MPTTSLLRDFRRTPENRLTNFVHDWAGLAIQLYHRRTSHPPAYRRHLFITSVDTVFHVMRARVACGHSVLPLAKDELSLVALLACMVHILRWSLIHRKYSCGSYTPFQWIRSISACYEAAKDSNRNPWTTVPLTGKNTVWPIFRLVLTLLKTCLDQGLLGERRPWGIDTINSDDFDGLMDLFGRPELPRLRHELSEPPTGVDCTWARPEDGVSTVVTCICTELTRPFTQPLEPFEFDANDIEGLTRRLEDLICEPIQGEERDEPETEVRIGLCCAFSRILTL